MVFFQVEASQLWLVVMGTLNDRSPDTRSPHKKVVSGTLEQQQLMVIGAVAPKASQLGNKGKPSTLLSGLTLCLWESAGVFASSRLAGFPFFFPPLLC